MQDPWITIDPFLLKIQTTKYTPRYSSGDWFIILILTLEIGNLDLGLIAPLHNQYILCGASLRCMNADQNLFTLYF